MDERRSRFNEQLAVVTVCCNYVTAFRQTQIVCQNILILKGDWE